MQVLSTLVITLGLAFSGVLGLVLVTHATSRTRRRRSPQPMPPQLWWPGLAPATVSLRSSWATPEGASEGRR
jgi:hypothetical protein